MVRLLIITAVLLAAIILSTGLWALTIHALSDGEMYNEIHRRSAAGSGDYVSYSRDYNVATVTK